MKKKRPTAGERMIAGAKQALAFARGEKDHGCIVHTPAMVKEGTGKRPKKRSRATLCLKVLQ